MATKQPPSGRRTSRPDSTELSVVPALSDPMSEPLNEPMAPAELDGVFRGTSGGRQDPGSSDVSVVEAVEDASIGSRELDGAGEIGGPEDRAPPQVMKIAFSELGPPELEEGARPLEVRTRRVPAPVAGPAHDLKSGGAAFAIADTKQTTMRDPTRVDTELEASVHASLDVAALRHDLDDIERLLRSTKASAAGLDLEAARGLNAQLASALHRVAEAKARLR